MARIFTNLFLGLSGHCCVGAKEYQLWLGFACAGFFYLHLGLPNLGTLMCYNVSTKLKTKAEYSKALKLPIAAGDGHSPKWEPLYHVSGFVHPELPAITDELPTEIVELKWGLIPFWVKDEVSAIKISNQTLNARGETIFEKPSFRDSAKNKRCLIIVDGFFEYQHRGGKTHPHFINVNYKRSCNFT